MIEKSDYTTRVATVLGENCATCDSFGSVIDYREHSSVLIECMLSDNQWGAFGEPRGNTVNPPGASVCAKWELLEE